MSQAVRPTPYFKAHISIGIGVLFHLFVIKYIIVRDSLSLSFILLV